LKTGDPLRFVIVVILFVLITGLFLFSVLRGRSPDFLLLLFSEIGSARCSVVFVITVTQAPVFLFFLPNY